jgi:hypothetical protein
MTVSIRERERERERARTVPGGLLEEKDVNMRFGPLLT